VDTRTGHTAAVYRVPGARNVDSFWLADVGDNQSSRSPDGRLFVLRTYADAYVWPLHDGDLRAALRSAPVRIRLPSQPQGEGVDVVGGTLWLSSEGRDQPIISVLLPFSPSSSAPAPGHGSSGSGIGWGLIAIVAAAVLAFVLGSRLRRRGRRKDHGGEDLSSTG
jgi:hypothetical protein